MAAKLATGFAMARGVIILVMAMAIGFPTGFWTWYKRHMILLITPALIGTDLCARACATMFAAISTRLTAIFPALCATFASHLYPLPLVGRGMADLQTCLLGAAG